MNGKLPISKETFVEAKTNAEFRGLLYDLLAHDAYCTEQRKEACDRRIATLGNRKKIDTGIAATSGFVGGFIAVWLKKVFFGG